MTTGESGRYSRDQWPKQWSTYRRPIGPCSVKGCEQSGVRLVTTDNPLCERHYRRRPRRVLCEGTGRLPSETIRGRAKCPACGKRVMPTKDGHIRAHSTEAPS